MARRVERVVGVPVREHGLLVVRRRARVAAGRRRVTYVHAGGRLLVALGRLATREDITPGEEWALVASVLLYFGLEALYLPFAQMVFNGEGGQKSAVRCVLMIAVLPVLFVTGMSVSKKDVLASVTSAFALAHVTFFDAVTYGFLM